MKKLTLIIATNACLICTNALTMDMQTGTKTQITKEPILSMGYIPIDDNALEGILTSEIISQTLKYKQVTLKSEVSGQVTSSDNTNPQTVIISDVVIARPTRCLDAKPHSVLISGLTQTKDSKRMSLNLKNAISISHDGEKELEIDVTVDWQKLNALLPKPARPSLLSRLADPVTLATALTTGVVVYYFAKNKGE